MDQDAFRAALVGWTIQDVYFNEDSFGCSSQETVILALEKDGETREVRVNASPDNMQGAYFGYEVD